MNIQNTQSDFKPVSDADLKALVAAHPREKIIATLQALSLPLESLSKRSQEERRMIRDHLEPPLPLEPEDCSITPDLPHTSGRPETFKHTSDVPTASKSESEPAKSELHLAALDFIARGYRIIPMVPGQKTPMMKQWHARAIETAEQADNFFSRHPDCNIGFCPEDMGLMVIDADTYRGEACDVASLSIPETFEVESPRGGTHYYLAGTAPPTSGKEGKYLGPFIDTRGRGSYVLLPPSVVDGKPYRVKADRAIAVLPLEIEAMLTRQDAAPATETRLDLPGNVSAARTRLADLVKAGKVSIAGQFGHDTCYEIACELVRDLGLSIDTALELMLAEWYPHCQPNNDPSFVRERVQSAARNGQNAIGAHATAPAAEVFAKANLPVVRSSVPAERSLLRSVSFADLLARPTKPVEELIPGLLEKGIATMLAGPGGTHKSRLALQWGLSMQAGIPIFGKVTEPCTFIYLDYENGNEETIRRTHKMQFRLKLPRDTAGHYYDLKGGPMDAAKGPLPANQLSPPLALIEETGITCQPLYFQLFDFLRSISGHKFIVADSCYNLLHFAGQTKINESAVKAALNLLDYLCAATDSTMVYLWHPSQAGQDRGDASGWSVAWHNTPRARLSLSKADKTQDAFELKVEKRNNGPSGGIITLHWRDGVLLPLSAADLAKQPAALFEACVAAALKAAEHDAPIQQQRDVAPWLMNDIERAIGKEPTQREVKEQLAEAVGRKRLRYVKGHGKQKAGYFAWSTDAPTLRLTGVDTTKRIQERNGGEYGHP